MEMDARRKRARRARRISLGGGGMKNLSSDDILIELEKRFGISGITEKNSRNDG